MVIDERISEDKFYFILQRSFDMIGMEGWGPIYRFNTATLLCLSQARTWFSYVVDFFMFNDLR
jgi:hypothetical protein